MMKKIMLMVGLVCLVMMPVSSYAIGLEVAVGSWMQSPSGDFAYEGVSTNDFLDFDDDLDTGDETEFSGRIKIDMPLLIPNIYIMSTPIEYTDTGEKSVDFVFGDETFSADIPFESKFVFDHYDIALYYGIPFTGLATLGKLNIDLGINVRLLDVEVEVVQPDTGFSDKGDVTAPIPMLYGAVQIGPISRVTLEAEIRAVGYRGNTFTSIIGRVKCKVFGPAYVAGGYRSDSLDIDEDDVEADITIDGLFFEGGLQF